VRRGRSKIVFLILVIFDDANFRKFFFLLVCCGRDLILIYDCASRSNNPRTKHAKSSKVDASNERDETCRGNFVNSCGTGGTGILAKDVAAGLLRKRAILYD